MGECNCNPERNEQCSECCPAPESEPWAIHFDVDGPTDSWRGESETGSITTPMEPDANDIHQIGLCLESAVEREWPTGVKLSVEHCQTLWSFLQCQADASKMDEMRIAELEAKLAEAQGKAEGYDAIMEAFEAALDGDTMYGTSPAELVWRVKNDSVEAAEARAAELQAQLETQQSVRETLTIGISTANDRIAELKARAEAAERDARIQRLAKEALGRQYADRTDEVRALRPLVAQYRNVLDFYVSDHDSTSRREHCECPACIEARSLRSAGAQPPDPLDPKRCSGSVGGRQCVRDVGHEGPCSRHPPIGAQPQTETPNQWTCNHCGEVIVGESQGSVGAAEPPKPCWCGTRDTHPECPRHGAQQPESSEP